MSLSHDCHGLGFSYQLKKAVLKNFANLIVKKMYELLLHRGMWNYFSVIISCILFKWILIIYLYEWKFTSIIGDCWLYPRALVILQGFTIPSDCLPQTFCHLLYQRQKTGTGYTKNPFKTASLDLLDYSYKIIMVGRNLT